MKKIEKIIELHAESFTMPFKRIFNSVWGEGGGGGGEGQRHFFFHKIGGEIEP